MPKREQRSSGSEILDFSNAQFQIKQAPIHSRCFHCLSITLEDLQADTGFAIKIEILVGKNHISQTIEKFSLALTASHKVFLYAQLLPSWEQF